jgi:hypothetical protein
MSVLEADYYDIDSILAEEEATPVQFRVDACKLGYLDPGSVDNDVRRRLVDLLKKEKNKTDYLT